ncbi:MAG TPA: AMP nucleosidase, partial [Rhodanobacteraceae bacterium]|nr:AMP nucleosidase [Rhodanobacteraceae bacterium]
MQDKLDIVRDWLPRYTGERLENFGQYILLTNFIGYVETFCELTGARIVDRERPMPCASADG